MAKLVTSLVKQEYTSFEILDALYAGFMTCVASIPQFLPFTEVHYSRQLLALAAVWAAMSSSLDYKTAVSVSWKLYLGSALGGTMSVIGAAIVMACNGGQYNVFWGSLFAVPFCFLGACTYIGKMSEVVSWVSFVVRVYSVATFSGQAQPFGKMTFTVIMAFIVELVPLFVVAVLNVFGLLPRKGPEPLGVFEAAARDLFQLSVLTGMDAQSHEKELERRKEAVHSALAKALPVASRDLQLAMFRMAAILDGFNSACLEAPVGPVAKKELWDPLQADFRTLSSKAYLLISEGGSSEAIAEIRRTAAALKSRQKQMLLSYNKLLVKQEDWKWVLSGRELSAIEAALIAVPRFTDALATYLERKKEGRRQRQWRDVVGEGDMTGYRLASLCGSLGLLLNSSWIPIPLPPFVFDLRAWWKKPLFPPISVWRIIAFPLRFTILVQLLLWPPLALSLKYPSLAMDGWWLSLVAVMCSFPEVGPTVSKTLRRLLGVMVGVLLSVIVILINPGNAVALTLELFIVNSAARLLTGTPKVGYAAFQTGITFTIMGFADSLEESMTQSGREIHAAKRIVFTLVGIIVSTIVHTLVWPSFSARLLAEATAAELKAISKGVATGLGKLLVQKQEDGRSPELVYETDVELSLFEADTARRAKIASVSEEDSLFRLMKVNTSGGSVKTRSLMAAQEAIGRAHTSALVTYESLIACDAHMSEFTASVLLVPLRARLSELADACLESGNQLAKVVEEKAPMELARGALQRTLDAAVDAIVALEDIRIDLLARKTWTRRLEDDDVSSTKMVEALAYGGALGLHVAMHTLETFVRDWSALSGILLGCDLHFPNPPAGACVMPQGKVPTLTTIHRRASSNYPVHQ
ncbi:hypothetical protein FOL47_010447 [Perkinsus chesapeaki]|uniref:Integral membrane bound transporter domain-containing protein n=1 Tax=Perkinsus chesapeaki TaxID=330153 RepID=A0A7J6MPL3_PERCH|nr:hypothetical protein FOL47_010447 [Perkinsus chesapeaki]